jgi:HEAT repeat protein
MGDERGVGALIAELESDNFLARERAVQVLGEIGRPQAIEPILKLLVDDTRFVREAAVKALDKLDPNWPRLEVARKALPKLADGLKHASRDVQEFAAEILGKTGDLQAMEPLIEMLKDPIDRVRISVRKALEQIEPNWARSEAAKGAIPKFVSALNDKNPHVRRASAETLAIIGDERGVRALMSELNREDWAVRTAAAEVLARLGDDRGVKALIRELRSQESIARAAASKALGNIGDPQAIRPLVQVLRDRDTRVREAADTALSRLGWQAPVQNLPTSVVVFRTGEDQPEGPLDYAKRIFAQKQNCASGNVKLDAWRIAGVHSDISADSAKGFYMQMKAAGQIPDFGPPTDTFEGQGPDGRHVVALFFGGVARPSKRIVLDVKKPLCALCGRPLSGGESILDGATSVISSVPTEVLRDDLTYFRGSICFRCRIVVCADCLGERPDHCPNCNGDTKPAFGRNMRELAGL